MRSNSAKGKRILHPKPASKRHHGGHRGKMWRQSCRIQLPFSCAARIFKLTKTLGLNSYGKTIEWMLSQLDQNIFSKGTNIGAANGKIPENSNPLSLSDPSSSVTSCQPEPPTEYENDQVPNKAETLPPSPENESGDGEWPAYFSAEDIMLLQSVFGFD